MKEYDFNVKITMTFLGIEGETEEQAKQHLKDEVKQLHDIDVTDDEIYTLKG